MAKILTGPLAAGLSGKLGTVVFHQTRFGQVVQSKAKTKVWRTPAAMATKHAFRVAAQSLPSRGDDFSRVWRDTFDPIGKSFPGQYIRAVSSAVRGDVFLSPPVVDSPGIAQVLNVATVAGQLEVTIAPTGWHPDGAGPEMTVIEYDGSGFARNRGMLFVGGWSWRTAGPAPAYPLVILAFPDGPTVFAPTGRTQRHSGVWDGLRLLAAP